MPCLIQAPGFDYTGSCDSRILIKRILPNALSHIFVVMAVVIMLESILSFFSIGVPLTEPSLGVMISIGKCSSTQTCS